MATSTPDAILDTPSREQIITQSGVSLSACFQCQKCTNGCPLVFAMDVTPHRLVHAIQLGMVENILESDTIWVCASCETCTTRCPNNIDIAHLMDTLRQISAKRGVRVSQKRVPVFHQTFLANIRRFGRMHEPSLVLTYAYRSGGLRGVLAQSGLGLDMLRKGKIRLMPRRLRAGTQVKKIFRDSERRGR